RSWIQSVSATTIRVEVPLEAVRWGAGFGGCFASAGGGSTGAPSGKALVSLPVMSAAIVFLPEGGILRARASGCANLGEGAATSPAWAEVWTSGTKLIVAPALGLTLPDSTKSIELSSAVGTAVGLKSSRSRFSQTA